MTHTLHRHGSVESLRDDYVVIAQTSRLNRPVTKPLLPKVAEMILDVGPSGCACLRANMNITYRTRDEYIQGTPKVNGLSSVYSTQTRLREMLSKLKEADLGISVTVSGLIDEVIPLAQELGYKPHTVNLSLGILGKTDRLPEEEVLEMTTMCGHAMISANLVRKALRDVATGAKTPQEATEMLRKPCVCGIFNLDRSEKMLQPVAEEAPVSLPTP